MLAVWDGNAIKLHCDDHCTTINVIKFIEYFKKKKEKENKRKAGRMLTCENRNS